METSPSLFFSSIFAAFVVAGAALAQESVRVFVLAGQSNMQGKGFPEPIAWQVTRAEFQNRWTRFVADGDHAAFAKAYAESVAKDARRPEYRWSVRRDVWVDYLGNRGPLTVGYASPTKCFGPEYNFGHVVGDALDQPVLIIKTAWGGKSLGKDFLSPSAPHPTAADYQQIAAERNARIAKENERNRKRHEESGRKGAFRPKPYVTAAEIETGYGHFYREMVRHVRETLAGLDENFPELRGRKPELAGFVWFQGWNDQFNEVWVQSYEDNLACLIRDVRKDLKAPELPVVIGQVGFDGMRPAKPRRDGTPSARQVIKAAQMGVSEREEFRGLVRTVRTDKLWDQEADAIFNGPGGWKADPAKWRQFGNDRPYHYLGSPWFYAQAGTAFGEAMCELIRER